MIVGVVLAGVLAWWWAGRGRVAREESEREEVAARAVMEMVTEEEDGDPRGIGFASISGKVSDPDGRAIAGAQVCAFAMSRLLEAAEMWLPRCATSGRDGVYVLERMWAVRQRISASAPGFVPAYHGEKEGAVELRAGVDVKGIDIVLPGGGVELRGVVKDLSGGAIEGALVRSGGMFQGTGVAVATSGADGEFSLWVRPGRPQVWAQAEGYAEGSDAGGVPGHRFEVFLTPEAVLVGKVMRASDGSPVVGAAVTAERGDAFGSTWRALTGADGSFRIDRLTPGAYKPKAESDDAYGVAAEQVVLGLGQTSRPIVIRTHPAFAVEGRVFVPNGPSCPSGTVMLKERATGRTKSTGVEADGAVRFAGVLDGTYEVTVSCTGHLAAERYEPVVVAGASATGLRWEVARGQAIRGVIVTAKGEPIAGIHVAADAKVDPSQPRARTTSASLVQSDAQGRFALSGLLPGKYEVKTFSMANARALPNKPVEVTLPPGQDVEGVRMEAPAIGEVRGEVRDAQGRGVGRVDVQLFGGGRGAQTTAADDGTFVLPEVEPGEYRAVAKRDWVTLRAPGTGDDDVQGVKVEVRVGETASVKLVVETGEGRIGGVVRDADGAPVVDAFIEAVRESDSAAAGRGSDRWFGGDARPHLTDADGRFSLEELFPGKYSVRAFQRGGGEATAEHVALGSEVALTIAPTGRMAGTAALAGGEAPQEFSVTVEEQTRGYRRRDSFFRTDGAWSFAELPPGNFKVQVAAAEGDRTIDVSLGSGEEKTGLRVELTGKVTVRGTVVDLEGRPVPGVAVRVDSGAFASLRTSGGKGHVSDTAGKFEVERAPTGTVSVVADPPSDEFAAAWFSTRLAGGPVVELPPIRLVRSAVKRGEAAGDLGIAFKQAEPGADPTLHRLIVAVVRAGSPAAAAGVRVGDEVVAVGGLDVSGANSYLYWALTRVRPGTTVTLGLARGGAVEVTTAVPP